MWKVCVVASGWRDEIGLSGGKLDGNSDIHSSSHHGVDPCRGTLNQVLCQLLDLYSEISKKKKEKRKENLYKTCPRGRN